MFVFFSSRRRHTRYWRDWSSDVCSSDLGARLPRRSLPTNEPERNTRADNRRRPITQSSPCSWRFFSLIGRGACRGRAEISGVAVLLKKKKQSSSLVLFYFSLSP